MAIAATDSARTGASQSRWSVAYACLAGLIVYAVALYFSTTERSVWINDIAWTIASGVAAWACLRTSRIAERARRRAWLLLGLGCTSWFIGQLHWNYSQLVLASALPFPSIGQIFFSAFALLRSPACCSMPEARERAQFTFKHLGNIGLVTCCLVVTIVLGMLEPALQIAVPASICGSRFVAHAARGCDVSHGAVRAVDLSLERELDCRCCCS